MVDPRTPTGPQPKGPSPKVSNRISPIAIAIAVALLAMVAIALLKTADHHVTPSGVRAPMDTPVNTLMPRQSTVPNTPAPMANTNDATEIQPAGNTGG
jgi:hypothetical protein